MKKIFSLLLVLLMLFTLAACGSAKYDYFIEGIGIGSSMKDVEKKCLDYGTAMYAITKDESFLLLSSSFGVGNRYYYGTFLDQPGQVMFDYEKNRVKSMTFSYMFYGSESPANYYQKVVSYFEEKFGSSGYESTMDSGYYVSWSSVSVYYSKETNSVNITVRD